MRRRKEPRPDPCDRRVEIDDGGVRRQRLDAFPATMRPRTSNCGRPAASIATSALVSITTPLHTVLRRAYHGRGGAPMELQFTAVFRKVPEGYIGFVEELPGANTQAGTLEEARANLREAVVLVLDANRSLAQEESGGGDIIREPITVKG
jgi:predicted RNase H-like HicB family nuclease